uniref:Uncharacterized protein n=1 Tax=Arundo donax TaxID=35708 RepID=A0A0A9DMH2_ARUDO
MVSRSLNTRTNQVLSPFYKRMGTCSYVGCCKPANHPATTEVRVAKLDQCGTDFRGQ